MMNLQPFPLDEEYRCPVCLDDLSPALVYSACGHRICANCVNSCGTKCPMSRQTSAPRPDHQFSGIVERQSKLRRFRCTRCGANEIPADAATRGMHVCGARIDHLAAKYKNLTGDNKLISERALRMIVCDALRLENYSNHQSANLPPSRNDESRVIDAILEETARLAELKRLARSGGAGATKNLILATEGNKKGAGGAAAESNSMVSALMNAPALSSASLLSDSPSLDGSSDKSSSVFVDFDYVASTLFAADPSFQHKRGKIENMSTTYNANIVCQLLANIGKKMVDTGLAPSVASVRYIVIGTAYSLRDAEIREALNSSIKIGGAPVEIQIVSGTRKKDDVERQLETDRTESRNDGAIVFVSGDIDFLSCTTKLIREGKIVTVAHNAARSSSAEKHVASQAPNSLWRFYDLLISTASKDVLDLFLEQHTRDRSFKEGSEETTRAFHERPEPINKHKAFGHAETVSSSGEWQREVNRSNHPSGDHKYLVVTNVVGHEKTKIYIHDTRMHGCKSATENNSGTTTTNYFVISAPNPRTVNPNIAKLQEKDGSTTSKMAEYDHVAIAAFPDTWEVSVSGSSTQLKNLEPTAGLETLLLSAATASYPPKIDWCRAGENCKRGISCVNAHKRGTPSVVSATTAATSKPTFSYAKMASQVGGTGVVDNAPATIIAASSSSTNKQTPGSLSSTLNNKTDSHSHHSPLQVPSSTNITTASGQTQVVELVNVAGDKMPVTELEPTGVFQFYKKHPQGIGKICVNYPDCDRGLQCMFVHLKKFSYDYEDDEEPDQQQDSSANQTSTPVVSSTTMFPSIPNDASAATPSRKQRKQQQQKNLQQEENVAPDASAAGSNDAPSVTTVTIDAAKTAAQAKLGHPVTIAAAAALAAAAANPLGESIHNLPSEVNVEGMLIALNKLEKNGIVEFAKRHPAQPAKWCLHYPNCKGNVKCGFAHPGKNWDKDSILDSSRPGYEIEGAQSVKEAVSAVASHHSPTTTTPSSSKTAATTKKEEPKEEPSAPAAPPQKKLPVGAVLASETPKKKQPVGAVLASEQQSSTTSKKSVVSDDRLPSLTDETFLMNSEPIKTVVPAVRSYKDSAGAAASSKPSATTTSAPPGSMASLVAKTKDKPMEPVREPIRIGASAAPTAVIAQPAPANSKPVPVKMVNVDNVLMPITDLERTAVFDFIKNFPDGIAKRCVHDPGCKHGEKCTFVHLKQSVIDAAEAEKHASSPAATWKDDDPKEFNIENMIVPRSKIERTAFVDYLLAHPGVIGKWCLKHPHCKKGAECSYVHRKM